MLLVVPVSHVDFALVEDQVNWCRELGSHKGHTALMVGAATVRMEEVKRLGGVLKAAGFDSVTAIRAHQEDPDGWPSACCAMFRLGHEWVRQQKAGPFLWIEGDAIPLKAGWLDEIDREYRVRAKPFMGTVFDMPVKHLNGVMVYPQDINRWNPYLLNGGGKMAWDLIRPEINLRHGHNTHLIQRMLADPRTNTPMTFQDTRALAVIRPGAVLFHGVKDLSLIRCLRAPEAVPEPKLAAYPSLHNRIRYKVRALLKGASDYYHSGNLGDLIYALDAIKASGGGDILVGPEQRQTARCAVPIDRSQFDLLLPLLAAQPYLRRKEYHPTYPRGARDLNHFRNHWTDPLVKKREGVDTLCKCHFLELGILHKYHDNDPWLTVPEPIRSGKIIVHRSPRYNAPDQGPQSFPWKRLVEQHAHDMLFVGLEAEWHKFQTDFATKVSFWRVKDLLEMARVIAGGRVFIGNQSSPLSIALGCGQRVLVEACPKSPDCRFRRATYQDQLLGEIEL